MPTKDTRPRKKPARAPPSATREQVARAHAKRSPAARYQDRKNSSRATLPNTEKGRGRWLKDPAHRDLAGLDAAGTSTERAGWLRLLGKIAPSQRAPQDLKNATFDGRTLTAYGSGKPHVRRAGTTRDMGRRIKSRDGKTEVVKVTAAKLEAGAVLEVRAPERKTRKASTRFLEWTGRRFRDHGPKPPK